MADRRGAGGGRRGGGDRAGLRSQDAGSQPAVPRGGPGNRRALLSRHRRDGAGRRHRGGRTRGGRRGGAGRFGRGRGGVFGARRRRGAASGRHRHRDRRGPPAGARRGTPVRRRAALSGPARPSPSARLRPRARHGTDGTPGAAPAPCGRARVIPLALFLLACATVYVGTVEAAFTTLMRLSLRLGAERRGRLERLGYLDDPLRLFVPVRVLQGVLVVAVTVLSMAALDARDSTAVALMAAGLVAFVLVCGYVLPVVIVRRDPERVLEALLPSLRVPVAVLQPLTRPLIRLLRRASRRVGAAAMAGGGPTKGRDDRTSADGRAELEEQEERRLLQSVVEFGETLVREVMTPRPDIVAVKADATLDELRALFTEEQYSRLPVFEHSLDTVLGFVFVKDLVTLSDTPGDERVVARLLRPAHTVPETKRVADLLKELQQARVQSAIVHDEYGGTAGLVTIEDVIEEIVGEIRDEYDVEADPIVDEGSGSFVFTGRVSVDDLSKRLDVIIEPQGFETVAGYLLARLGRVPQEGESFEVDGLSVDVLEAERRRLHRVRLRRTSAAALESPA
ncbi:MAG: HlyC/CorC family transporter [Acidobacteria bacterium]|nr:HlyC/CorC family transporter [Acidobacteriota bacterium]